MSATRGKFWLWVVQKRGQAQRGENFGSDWYRNGGKLRVAASNLIPGIANRSSSIIERS